MPRTDRRVLSPKYCIELIATPGNTSAVSLAFAGDSARLTFPKPALTDGLVPDVLLGAADHVITVSKFSTGEVQKFAVV